jgi:hypothetical protein
VISAGAPHCTGHHHVDTSRPRGFFSTTGLRRKREHNGAGLLDSDAPLNRQWTHRDGEAVT